MGIDARKADRLLHVGVDVGSTTVKAVVMNAAGALLWKDYRRHNAKQPELVLSFMDTIEQRFSGHDLCVFTTGNGGRVVTPYLNATHIQEVNAVSYTVEKCHPEAGSVVELGGQDAKVILWKDDGCGRRTTTLFMNDKCAGGTGATLDKIFTKIGVTAEDAARIDYAKTAAHHVAAKCGVFAETDVIGLLKAGVDKAEIVVSLCTAIVNQNIEVLLHGNALCDDVLLLGGPHTYLPILTDIWRKQIPKTWKLHKWSPKNRPIDELVYVPPNAQYFAAIGAVLFGRESAELSPAAGAVLRLYPGNELLRHYLDEGRESRLVAMSTVRKGLVASEEERRAFEDRYAAAFAPLPKPTSGETLRGYLGIDGGSTSSKLAILDEGGRLVYRDYRLSEGNPISDVRAMFTRIHSWLDENRIRLDLRRTAVTGYAADILEKAFCLDLTVVETIAHLKSARKYYGEVDVICDVGGQDIKVLFLKHGRVVDIRLNTQCSAGNGYFLQNMAEQFGVPMEEYAARAFEVRRAPAFNYGCAVFMEQDKVNFQQQGWTKHEIMAGLALVLPLNIWNYVAQETNLRRLGKRFLLQGGTQKNLAVVKAEVDFIESKVPDAEVILHPYADICGAIGAAEEALETAGTGRSRFIGLNRAEAVAVATQNDASTVCAFCSNRCRRTFIDIATGEGETVRHITGNGCEKGQSTNVADMREAAQSKKSLIDEVPNMVALASRLVFDDYPCDEPPPGVRNAGAIPARRKMVIGIPKLLNLYVYAPFFSTYLKALGVGEVVYSDYTSKALWDEGNTFGAIDPCFPAKVAPAHIYNLLQNGKVTHILFPIITHLESIVDNTLGNNACVIQMGTPEVAHAAFTKSGRDYLAERGIEFLKPLVRMDRAAEAAGNLYEYFRDRLMVTEAENAFAVEQGSRAMARYFALLRNQGASILNRLVEEDRIGILFIGHPYHHDPGFNHGILEAFQLRGFPVLCIESLPTSDQFLGPLFGEESRALERGAFDITDVWQRNFNRNTNMKVWAAKVAARHPNLAVIDLSSFKCGHDAPTYSYVDAILDASETPHFLFHDIDQNRPAATLDIRIKSIDYFLHLEEERLKSAVLALRGDRQEAAS